MRNRGWLMTLAVFGISLVVFAGFWYGMFLIANVAGFNKQITPQYGFSSGIGPMILAALGYSTLVASLWHGFNCHEQGCWAIGRHRVNGTPWCNAHHEQARTEITDSDRLDRIISLMEAQQRHDDSTAVS